MEIIPVDPLTTLHKRRRSPDDDEDEQQRSTKSAIFFGHGDGDDGMSSGRAGESKLEKLRRLMEEAKGIL